MKEFKVEEVTYHEPEREFDGHCYKHNGRWIQKSYFTVISPEGVRCGNFKTEQEAKQALKKWFSKKTLDRANKIKKEQEKIIKQQDKLRQKIRELDTKYFKLNKTKKIPEYIYEYFSYLKD